MILSKTTEYPYYTQDVRGKLSEIIRSAVNLLQTRHLLPR